MAVLVAAACSGGEVAPPTADARSQSEAMIAGELATAIGLGPLTPSCNEPGPLTVGTTFTCAATRTAQPPGDPIQIETTVQPDGHLKLVTLNLISAAALPSFERRAAAQLNEATGSNFTADSVDCGNTAIVLPADATIGCALIMPASGQVFDLTLAVTDLDARHFALAVADSPRNLVATDQAVPADTGTDVTVPGGTDTSETITSETITSETITIETTVAPSR
jgi:hypothetical protein